MKIAGSRAQRRRSHHRSRLPADQISCDHPLLEVIDRDLGLESNGVIVALDIAPKLLLGPFRVEFRIIVDGLDERVVALDWRIARDDLVRKDEPLATLGLERAPLFAGFAVLLISA
jgi:hypothetical protein